MDNGDAALLLPPLISRLPLPSAPLCPTSPPAAPRVPQGEGEAEAGGEGDEVAVDNGDTALLLLRALAAQDPEVTQQLTGEAGVISRRCSIM